jgi:hypothetical protein
MTTAAVYTIQEIHNIQRTVGPQAKFAFGDLILGSVQVIDPFNGEPQYRVDVLDERGVVGTVSGGGDVRIRCRGVVAEVGK